MLYTKQYVIHVARLVSYALQICKYEIIVDKSGYTYTITSQKDSLAEREREISLAARRDICAEVSPRINQHYKYDRCLSTCYKHLAHALGCLIMA